jgi:hypothetical protein
MTKGVVIMSKFSHFKRNRYWIHPIPALILKVGFWLLSLYTALLFILVDQVLPCDPGYAYYILLPTLEDFVIALVALLFGTALLNRLYQRET